MRKCVSVPIFTTKYVSTCHMNIYIYCISKYEYVNIRCCISDIRLYGYIALCYRCWYRCCIRIYSNTWQKLLLRFQLRSRDEIFTFYSIRISIFLFISRSAYLRLFPSIYVYIRQVWIGKKNFPWPSGKYFENFISKFSPGNLPLNCKFLRNILNIKEVQKVSARSL